MDKASESTFDLGIFSLHSPLRLAALGTWRVRVHRAVAGKLCRFHRETFQKIVNPGTRIVWMDQFHVTSWYKFSGFLKTFLVESASFPATALPAEESACRNEGSTNLD